MNSEITSETQFPEAVGAENLQGSCAARNIQNFGVATLHVLQLQLEFMVSIYRN